MAPCKKRTFRSLLVITQELKCKGRDQWDSPESDGLAGF
jgi:hypothetical protein